jgi:hypothetical protein
VEAGQQEGLGEGGQHAIDAMRQGVEVVIGDLIGDAGVCGGGCRPEWESDVVVVAERVRVAFVAEAAGAGLSLPSRCSGVRSNGRFGSDKNHSLQAIS